MAIEQSTFQFVCIMGLVTSSIFCGLPAKHIIKCYQYLNGVYMNYEDRDTHGIYENYVQNKGISLRGVSALIGNEVCNENGEDLGSLKEIMLDTASGKVHYAILSFGGILGIGSKLFAIPWSALKLDAERKHFVLNMDKDRLNYMPGFDKDKWPDITTCF